VKVNKPILILLAVTILVCGYVFFFTGKPNAPPPVANKPPVDAAAILAQARQKLGVGNRASLGRIEVVWGKDPFELPKAFESSRVEVSAMPAKLVAILSGRSGRVALIGSEVVKKGDVIFGEKVVDIGQNRVVLQRGDSTRYLTLEDKGREEVMRNTRSGVDK
jgi:hypothetical protein